MQGSKSAAVLLKTGIRKLTICRVEAYIACHHLVSLRHSQQARNTNSCTQLTPALLLYPWLSVCVTQPSIMQPPLPPEPLYVLRGHRAAVQCTAFFPNCQVLAAGDAEGELKLWDLDSRRVTSSIRAHETHAGILQVACPSSSTMQQPYVISQGRDGVVKCWQVHSGTTLSSEPVQVLSAGSYNFCRFALLEPGQSSSSCGIRDAAATAGTLPEAESSIKQLLEPEPAAETVQGFEVSSSAAATSADTFNRQQGSSSVSKQRDPSRQGLLAMQLQQKQQQQQELNVSTSDTVSSPSLVAAAGAAAEMSELTEDLEESLVLGQLHRAAAAAAPSAAAEQPAVGTPAAADPSSSSSGRGTGASHCWLALPAADAADVGIWCLGQPGSSGDNSTGPESRPAILLRQERSKEKPSHGLCMAIALLQPEGASLYAVTGYEDGTVALWDIRNPNRYLASTRLHSESVMCLAIAASCKSGFSGSADESLAAFDVSLPKGSIGLAQQLRLPGKPGIADVAVRPDGRIAASAGWDGKIRVWHGRKRTPLAVLRWHSQQVACVSFSRDNKLLAAGGRDNHISLWSLYPPGA